ncbi:2-dehydropantoate 2-reductase N-terminal domain-containing protein [Bacillus gaemokensis]|uniref:Ketopantoate reductase N-terminal domain-containing protein n=1 Tax=Bacillus gaemokensis TaxID=574375 RepID=A0A073KRN5_9BACI|nr:2-dehydropantoate 2-reductase N-terminal domain-containing protein [Bacillus gaemokensis]KEK25038.1 hypothetical protein BAGA_18250 [Bacillus gaemokensis]KYG32576.1 hypothetical protein AZF08_10760 [Bacillus gaemokensis]
MRFLIVGAGVIGGYFGGRLIQKGVSLVLVEQRILGRLKQTIESFEIQENMVHKKKIKNNILLQQKALEK